MERYTKIIMDYHIPVVLVNFFLEDKGYISHKIHEKLTLKGITISVPPRKNMDKSEKLDHSLLGKQRKIRLSKFQLTFC